MAGTKTVKTKINKNVIGRDEVAQVVAVAGGPFGSVFGNTYYVDSTHVAAVDSPGNGVTRVAPFATINYAITRCADNQGDTILVAPNHAEEITEAGGIDVGTAGISIKGTGWGSLRPKITFTTATSATFTVTAANVWIENLWFECDKTGADLVAMVVVSQPHCTLKNCVFTEGAADEQALISVKLSATTADYCTIDNCRIISETAGAAKGVSVDAVVNEFKMIGTNIQGDFGDACLYSASAHLNCLVSNNFMRNDGAGDHAVEFAAAATGIIAWNAVGTAVTAGGAADVMDIGSCKAIENYAADADADTSGVLTPPATS